MSWPTQQTSPLPTEPGERAFALARRMALATSESTELVVVEDEAVVARTSAPIATSSSLIALKAVAMPHRSQSSHPAKVGSDIHDLIRLVQGCDFDETVASITGASAELRNWGRDNPGQMVLTRPRPPIHLRPTPSASSISRR